MREQVTFLLKDELVILECGTITSRDSFDLWHRNLSEKIKNVYADNEIKFTVGQAQKWINMTIKYLYLMECSSFEGVFDFLYIHLDNYVFDIATTELNIERPNIAWSRWDDYDQQYLMYQNEIRHRMNGFTPLRWEFKYWLKVARKIEVV